MSTLPVAAFAEVTDALAELVDAVTAQQWSAPTPCTEWNVQQLVEHVVAGTRTFAVALGAELPELDSDATPESLKDSYRTSTAALVAAFEEPGALERLVQAPIGEVPGAVALHLLTIDNLAHGWDLATAIDQKPLFDDATVEHEIEFAQGLLQQTPTGPGAPFAASRPAPEDAAAIDRLAALLGRELAN